MNKTYNIITIIALFFASLSCNPQADKTETKENEDVLLCKNFIRDLSNNNIANLKTYFDEIVLKSATDSTLDTALHSVYAYFKNSFPDEVTSKFVSEEKTTRENISSNFILLKIETPKVFGYYNFYLNSETHKIILVQNAVTATPKRD